MSGQKETHPLDWQAGRPVSKLFDDGFQARGDGPAETRHVFIAGNNLPVRWKAAPYFSIAELGFGTGLNFLETWRLWRATRPFGAQLSYTGFEAYPLTPQQMERALAQWPDLAPLAQRLLPIVPSSWPDAGSERPIRLDRQTQLTLIIGDACETVPHWPGRADCWFLDGFAPARNPQMWTEELLRAVAGRTVGGGSFATYAAAGFVRRNLTAAGFAVRRLPGYGAKREMLAGKRID